MWYLQKTYKNAFDFQNEGIVFTIPNLYNLDSF